MGGWVGGWVGGWMEGELVVGMRCCWLGMGGWVGGWVGGWIEEKEGGADDVVWVGGWVGEASSLPYRCSSDTSRDW